MRPLERLSPYEFEGLVGDLLGARRNRIYERFRRGADLGIDLRHYADDGTLEVVQCKHYLRSSFTKLRQAARAERERLVRLDPKPDSYWFVTSQGLSPQNKSALVDDLSGPWIDRPDRIVGADDIEALLDAHSEVERRHIKMWLPGGTALAAMLRAGTYHRSRVLMRDIEADLHLYVQTQALDDAREILHREGVCLISGPPGIGKTTLARMLLAEGIYDGWEPIEVSHDVSEAWDVLDPEALQVFYYDDFLGTTTLGELEKNEDRRLISLMENVGKSAKARFVLTTREYILQQAVALYEAFRQADLPDRRFMLTLEGYSRFDRALILHNHLYHSSLEPEVLEGIAAEQRYERIIGHRNFNPRLISLIVRRAAGEERPVDVEDFVSRAEAVLNNPTELWRTAFERQLDRAQQALLLVLVSLPREAQVSDLEKAHYSYCQEVGIATRSGLFEDSLRILDDTFTRSLRPQDQVLIEFANPSIEDFVRSELSAPSVEALLRSSLFFEQLDRLLRLAAAAEISLDAELVTQTAIRTFDAETADWIVHVKWDESETLERHDRGSEGRLSALIDLARSGKASDSLTPWIESKLAARLEEWAEGRADARQLLSLVRRLVGDERPHAPAGWEAAAKTALLEQAVQPEIYRELAKFRELFPDALTDTEWNEARMRFASEAHDDLNDNAGEFHSDDVVDEYVMAADDLGVQLDPDAVQSARDAVGERMAERDPDEDYDRDLWRERVRESKAEEAEIDGLFRRLADD